jgi:hypothetical protein
MLFELPSTIAGAKKLAPVGRTRLRQPYGGLINPTRIENPLGFQFLALGKERVLARCGFRLVESDVKD